MNPKTYTIEQIKEAFWAEFHETGELWFDYLGTDETNNNSTSSHFQGFLERLQGHESN